MDTDTSVLSTAISLLTSVFFMVILAGCVGGDGNDQNDTNVPTLEWDAPLTRINGSKLFPGEIDRYRVYFRRVSEDDFRVETIDSAGKTAWKPSFLESGIYIFAVSTVDTAGLESPRSETLRVTMP